MCPGSVPLHPERVTLHPERVTLHPERGALHPERGALHPERGALHPLYAPQQRAAAPLIGFAVTEPLLSVTLHTDICRVCNDTNAEREPCRHSSRSAGAETTFILFTFLPG